MDSNASALLNSQQTFPLSKIGIATTATVTSRPVPVHHRGNAFAVFDTERFMDVSETMSERSVLKLIRGPDVVV